MSTSTETHRSRRSEFAVASLTMGVLPATVFGVLALRRMKADGESKGKGLAVAGIVLGAVGVVVLPTLGIIVLTGVLPILRGFGAGTVALEGDPDPAGAAAQIRKSAEAFDSAQTWLNLVDLGQYAAAWEASAGANKDAITKDSMVEKYSGFRAPMGRVVSRKLKSARYTTSLPGAPPGEYVMIEFNTTFDNSGGYLERITPMLDADGQWKVSGYYLLR